jgi:hypothetical protein
VNATIKDFIDVGDLGAPIGSPAWCKAAHVQLCATKHQADLEVKHLKYDLREFRDKERWKQLTDSKGKPFRSWKHYVETPEPDGLGMPQESVEAVLKALDKALIGQVLGKHGRPAKGEEKGDNVTFKRGNQAAYFLARLKRDRPDLLESFYKGDFKSARAAAIAAGIIKVKTPLEQLRTIWRKANEDERRIFLKEITPE